MLYLAAKILHPPPVDGYRLVLSAQFYASCVTRRLLSANTAADSLLQPLHDFRRSAKSSRVCTTTYGRHSKQIGPHGLVAHSGPGCGQSRYAADLTVYFAVTSNQRRPYLPLRRYIAQANLSGRVHWWCAHRQWLRSPVKTGTPVFSTPVSAIPQPLTDAQAPSLSGRYPCPSSPLLARSEPCPCSSWMSLTRWITLSTFHLLHILSATRPSRPCCYIVRSSLHLSLLCRPRSILFPCHGMQYYGIYP
jgi:hypothetical protein